MTAAHPLFGVGVSQYGFNYRPYQLTDVFDVTRPVKPIAAIKAIRIFFMLFCSDFSVQRR